MGRLICLLIGHPQPLLVWCTKHRHLYNYCPRCKGSSGHP